MFSFIARYFQSRGRRDDGTPVIARWVGDDDAAALINVEAGRVYGRVMTVMGNLRCLFLSRRCKFFD